MKRILALSLMLILMCSAAWAQPEPPSTPPSPQSLGLTPPDPSASTQAPPASESDEALMSTSQLQATAAAPEVKATATSTSTEMVVPQGVAAPNYLYIPYYPSTTAGCYFGQWLEMWMDVRGTGPLYIYEWYPDGRLVSSYLAYIPYPGWQKMWFYGDTVGWHTLQYYCNGWSNYIYVCVQGTAGPSSPYPPAPTSPYPPVPTSPYPPGSGSGCNANVLIISNSMNGYSVYSDGAYVGKDGQGNPLDGRFSFSVAGNQQHTIQVYDQGYSYTSTKSYSCGGTYTLTI